MPFMGWIHRHVWVPVGGTRVKMCEICGKTKE